MPPVVAYRRSAPAPAQSPAPLRGSKTAVGRPQAERRRRAHLARLPKPPRRTSGLAGWMRFHGARLLARDRDGNAPTISTHGSGGRLNDGGFPIDTGPSPLVRCAEPAVTAAHFSPLCQRYEQRARTSRGARGESLAGSACVAWAGAPETKMVKEEVSQAPMRALAIPREARAGTALPAQTA